MRIVLILLSVYVIGLQASIYREAQSIQDDEPGNARQLYESFKRKYNKITPNHEDEFRFQIFKDNLKLAEYYNSVERGTAKYGITQFSDLTADEFVSKLGLKNYINKNWNSGKHVLYSHAATTPPSSFDWREKGAVGPVERQGVCVSDWAFSAMGNIEGQWFVKTGKLYKFSKQQLLDCDNYDNGCDGGVPLGAYQAIEQMGGVELDSDYPYKAKKGKCSIDESLFVGHVNGYRMFDADEVRQASYLAEYGPLSVVVNAKMLQVYTSGIMHPDRELCDPSGINLAVLTVGYGEEGENPYWIVKNAWGVNWGEDGYFRIFRGDGTCGINLFVTAAVIP